MLIKKLLASAMAKITGRKCSNCTYNRGGRCAHPIEGMYLKCWQSITKPGHAGKYERTVFTLSVTAGEWDGLLSEEEQHQLQKIKASLQAAGDIARESGLVESKTKPPICIDRDKETHFCDELRCPVCDTFLASYTYGRAGTENGLPEDRRPATCCKCGQEIDWSGVPYPPKTQEG